MEELYEIKNDEVIVEQMICIFYTIIVAYTFYDWTINKDELNKLQKYNKIIDLSIDLNQYYYQKEKKLTSYITGEIQKEIKQDINIEKMQSLKNI